MTYRSVVIVAAAVLALSGCSTADDQADTTPAVVPDATTEVPTPTPTKTPLALGDEALLEPSEMPPWNNAGTWTVLSSGLAWTPGAPGDPLDDTDALRACTLPTAKSLGALESLTRTFEYVVTYAEDETPYPGGEPMLGVNEVAAWADAAAAVDAVEAWTDALEACSTGTGPLTTIDGGSTWTYSLRDETSMNEAWFDFVGVAAKGSTTTLVGFSLWGQDANVESDPLLDSLQTSLDRLP